MMKHTIKIRKHKDVHIREMKIADQFTHEWRNLIEEYHTPNAICGYIAMAVALYISNQYPLERMRKSEVEEMIASLQNTNNLKPIVSALMKALYKDRERYISQNEQKFKNNEKLRNKYLTNWVANYEIGDWLSNLSPFTENIHFLRCIERNRVEDEEYDRMIAEDVHFTDFKIFFESLPPIFDCNDGHQSSSNVGIIQSGAKKLPDYLFTEIENVFKFNQKSGDGDDDNDDDDCYHSNYQSYKRSLLFSPSQFICYHEKKIPEMIDTNSLNYQSCIQIDERIRKGVYIVDSLGHFVVSKAIFIDDEPTLVVFNSMSSPSSEKFMFSLLSDLLFYHSSEISDPFHYYHTGDKISST